LHNLEATLFIIRSVCNVCFEFGHVGEDGDFDARLNVRRQFRENRGERRLGLYDFDA